jgi:hypothetical protein
MDLIAFFVPQIGAMLVLLLLAKLIAGKADFGREARTEGGRTLFEPNRRSFYGVYLFIAAVAYVVVVTVVRASGSAFAVASIASGFVLFLLMAFPATIVTDENGIEQNFWLRGRKRIAWTDVTKYAVDEKTGELKIASKTGVKIMHTRQLPDRDRLLAEVQRRAIERTVVIPPAPAQSELVAGAQAASNSSAA